MLHVAAFGRGKVTQTIGGGSAIFVIAGRRYLWNCICPTTWSIIWHDTDDFILSCSLIIPEKAVREATPVCGVSPHTDLQLYCKGNSSPALHHGAAFWATIVKPGRVTLPWDELWVRAVMGLHLLFPPGGFGGGFDLSKGVMAEVILCSCFCSSRILGINMLESVTKKSSAYQLTCSSSQRVPTMHGQQAPAGKVGQQSTVRWCISNLKQIRKWSPVFGSLSEWPLGASPCCL